MGNETKADLDDVSKTEEVAIQAFHGPVVVKMKELNAVTKAIETKTTRCWHIVGCLHPSFV